MDFPSDTGSGRAVVNGIAQSISWRMPPGDYVREITLSSGNTFTITDYEKRMDFHYAPSDDGSEYYHTLVLLAPDESDPAAPAQTDLNTKALAGIHPLLDKVIKHELDQEDMNWARLLFTKIDCMVRPIQKHGSIEAAQQAITNMILHHHVVL